jgi:hypothetical protein
VGQKKYTVWVGLLALLPLAVLLFTGSVLVRAAVCPEVGQRATHRFFAIIEVAMPAEGKKRDWFDLGAAAYAQACPGTYAAPTYVCPVCRNPFTVEALAGHRLR